jgi:tetratricopeptide (TPR) repeat protein
MQHLGRYELVGTLGQGGMGTVYDAVLQGPGGIDKPVALKVLHQGSEALRREARIGGLLRHRHLVDVYEIGEDDGTWFCAMERCEGSLADHLPLPPRAVVEAGLAVCDALQYAHTDLGLVHLDLKPDNLLYAADGTVKVADLGIARAEGFERDGIRGTPGYMAPEQARGDDVDARADIHALGVTLAELATGTAGAASTLDWFADTTRSGATVDDVSLAPETSTAVPDWLAPIVERCTAPDPEGRYPDMQALAKALRAIEVGGAGLRVHLRLDAHAEPTQRSDTNLGDEPDAFVGREDELATLAAAFSRPCLVTLKGPAGVGKSRLAAAAARRWYADHPGRQAWFCDLTEARSLDGLVSAVAQTLSIPLGKADLVVQLGHAIAGCGPSVFVFDNYEQVREHANVVQRWSERAREARFVVTSRVGLGLDGGVVNVDVLPISEAEALLIARARQRGADVQGDPDLSELATRLEGLPLALELAAGRLGVLSVRDVLDRFELAFLRRGTDDRHGTLRAAFDWSWDLLAPAEQAGLAQLSVFRGGLPLEAASEVLELPGGARALDVVETLLERSWLRAREGRLVLLDSVRAYASEKLDEDGAAVRHGVWVAGLRRGLGPLGSTNRLRALSADLENCVVACRRAVERGDATVAIEALEAVSEVVEQTGPATAAADLAALVSGAELPEPERARADLCLGIALATLGRMDDARDSYRRALRLARGESDRRLVGDTLRHLYDLDEMQGRPDDARQGYERVLLVAREIGDRDLEGQLLNGLGVVHSNQGRPDEARECYERALEIHRDVGNRRQEGRVSGHLGIEHARLRRQDEARDWYQRALDVVREVGDFASEGTLFGNLAVLELRHGRTDSAVDYFERALPIHRMVGHRRGEASALANLGIVHGIRGHNHDARECLESALHILREVGDRRSEAVALGNLARVHIREGRPEEASELYERALVLHRQVGATQSESNILGSLGVLRAAQGRIEEARACHERALDVAREAGHRAAEGVALHNLGALDANQGRLDDARESIQRALDIYRELGTRGDEGTALAVLGALHQEQGQTDEARTCLFRAVEIHREVGDRRMEGRARLTLAELEASGRDLASARAHLQRAELLLGAGGPPGDLAELEVVRAEVQYRAGNREAAEAALAEAEATAPEHDPHIAKAIARARALLDGEV